MTTKSEKKRQIIAIGGGGFGRNPNGRKIESYILEQTGLEKPNICFIPTASAENPSYIVNFYTCFSKLSCNPVHLNFFERTPNLRSFLAKQDVIYVGGGNTKSMLAVWREWHLDELLLKAYEKGVVLCGVSAGAICWFEKGVTDSWASSLNVLGGLNFIKETACPHYDGEKDRRPSVHAMIEDKKFESCYAAEDGAAMHFINEQFHHVVSFEKEKTAYLVKKEGGNIVEEKLKTVSIV
jgi:aminopeptidase N